MLKSIGAKKLLNFEYIASLDKPLYELLRTYISKKCKLPLSEVTDEVFLNSLANLPDNFIEIDNNSYRVSERCAGITREDTAIMEIQVTQVNKE